MRTIFRAMTLALMMSIGAHTHAQQLTPAWGCGREGGRADDALERIQVRWKRTDGTAVYRTGHGSPIVLVTGFRATLGNWNTYFIKALSRHHEVILFDNRGVGEGEKAESYRIEDLADDTAMIIQSLKLENVTLLGWSMGGAIAQETALRHPGVAKRLVLMSSLPPGSESIPVADSTIGVLSGEGERHFSQAMQALFPPEQQEQAMTCFLDDMTKPPEYVEAPISKSIVQAQTQLLQTWDNDDAAFVRLKKLNVPTLILAGTADTVISPWNSLLLKQALPDAELTMVGGGGHAMMYQYPVQLADKIEVFVSRRK